MGLSGSGRSQGRGLTTTLTPELTQGRDFGQNPPLIDEICDLVGRPVLQSQKIHTPTDVPGLRRGTSISIKLKLR